MTTSGGSGDLHRGLPGPRDGPLGSGSGTAGSGETPGAGWCPGTEGWRLAKFGGTESQISYIYIYTYIHTYYIYIYTYIYIYISYMEHTGAA